MDRVYAAGTVLMTAASCLGAGVQDRHMILGVWWNDVGSFREHVEAARSRGFDGIRITAPWHRLEPEAGRFDFSEVDERMAVVAEAGMVAVIDIDCGRGRPAWTDREETAARHRDGSVCLYSGPPPYPAHGQRCDSRRMPSVAHSLVRAGMARAAGELARHVRSRWGDRVLFVYVVFSMPQETEFFCPRPAGGDPWIDFSTAAQEGFRDWLRERFESLETLNRAWGRRYGSWDQATLQSAHPWDFFSYRTETLGRLLDEIADRVHETPGARAGAQFGCIWDGLAMQRGTVDAERLVRRLDVMFVDDGPPAIFNNRFSMDRTRAAGGDREFGDEIDGPWHPNRSDDGWREQGIISYDRGCRYVFCANWSPAHLNDRETWTLFEDVARHRHVAGPRPEPRRAVFLSLAEAYNGGDPANFGGYGMLESVYTFISGPDRLPVDVVADRVILERPEQAGRYGGGIWIPATQRHIASDAWAALLELGVPVYAESEDAGSRDEYGRPRDVAGVLPAFPE